MRSRQTGHVGSSIREGVGGASGFVDSDTADKVPADGVVGPREDFVVAVDGVKGLSFISGKLLSAVVLDAWISIDFTNTTW